VYKCAVNGHRHQSIYVQHCGGTCKWRGSKGRTAKFKGPRGWVLAEACSPRHYLEGLWERCKLP